VPAVYLISLPALSFSDTFKRTQLSQQIVFSGRAKPVGTFMGLNDGDYHFRSFWPVHQSRFIGNCDLPIIIQQVSRSRAEIPTDLKHFLKLLLVTGRNATIIQNHSSILFTSDRIQIPGSRFPAPAEKKRPPIIGRTCTFDAKIYKNVDSIFDISPCVIWNKKKFNFPILAFNYLRFWSK
jgi:hypothetical protein